ncbi:MAG TPA: malonyl-ACP O-methyltransferase BioC [Thiotrichaceae bacterium]|jgi:malonyl-CoA O-methyltransferase|nr:malonyl-ACP O-methyltransferase BioC [Thiotrichaceae bacterium]HIM08460.1 malonyl-[acyl-carrier protein] O-methyltransferase BioC [Gammaproteobacteria bacterium]
MKDSIQNNYQLDSKSVREAFNVAATKYDDAALLQQTVADRLIESFEHIKIKPKTILELGAGTGYGSRLLKQLFKKAQIYQVDISVEMIKNSRTHTPRFFSNNHFLCADANKIPLVNNSVDCVFSSLMLQWCNDLDQVFSEIKRVLKPGGVFMFASFGPDTLKELRESWRKVDNKVHVNAFVDMHDIGDSLMRNGMDAPVLSIEHIILTYDGCKQLMRELKNIGAHNVNNGRRKTLTGKQRLQKVMKHYESYRKNNKLPATYEVIYGHAWKSETVKNIKTDTNIQTISLADLKKDLASRKPK